MFLSDEYNKHGTFEKYVKQLKLSWNYIFEYIYICICMYVYKQSCHSKTNNDLNRHFPCKPWRWQITTEKMPEALVKSHLVDIATYEGYHYLVLWLWKLGSLWLYFILSYIIYYIIYFIFLKRNNTVYLMCSQAVIQNTKHEVHVTQPVYFWRELKKWNKLPLNNSHEKVHDRVIHNHQKLGKYPSHEWANILCSRL